MTLAEQLNAAVKAALGLPVAGLETAYQKTVAKFARAVEARFNEIVAAPPAIVAAASWQAPQVDDVLRVVIDTGRIRRGQHALLESVGGQMAAVEGIDWTITHPVVQEMLDKLALRAEGMIREGVRETVARVIADSWAKGLGVRETAALLRVEVAGTQAWVAESLARTDLVSLSNGSGHWGVDRLNESADRAKEPRPIQSRTWQSSLDGRVRDTHSAANGQTVPYGQPFNVGGFPLEYPGDPSGPHAEVMNCRCVELFNETAVQASGGGMIPVLLQEQLRAGQASGRLGPLPASWYAASSRPLTPLPSERHPEEVTMKTKRQKRQLRFSRVNQASVSVVPVIVAAATDEEGRTKWHSDMVFEGVPTGDGRFIVRGALRTRELPLTLMAMVETTGRGHDGAEVAGRIDTFDMRDIDMEGTRLPDGVASGYSTGVFDVAGFGQEIERMVGDRILRGISVDLAVFDWAFRDPETGEIIDPETATDEQWDKAFFGELDFAMLDAELMASTVCPTPAFADARIAVLASGVSDSVARTWQASAAYAAEHGLEEGQLMTTIVASMEPIVTARTEGGSIIASAEVAVRPDPTVFRRGIGALRPNPLQFQIPEPDEGQPVIVEDDGTLTGHLALWDSCHTGYRNGAFSECILPPRSLNNYAGFHLAPLELDDGSFLDVGKLTVGTGHADPKLGLRPARLHYDHTGSVAAYVRITDGKLGPWMSGVTRSDMTDEQLRDLRVNPPSGDWRDGGRGLELLAALAVVCPGFPVTRSQATIVASAEGVKVQTLIIAGGAMVLDRDPTADALHAAIEGPAALDELIQDCGC